MRNTAVPGSLCPCSATEAWAWVSDIAEEALNGDADAMRLLPAAITHALRVGFSSWAR